MKLLTFLRYFKLFSTLHFIKTTTLLIPNFLPKKLNMRVPFLLLLTFILVQGCTSNSSNQQSNSTKTPPPSLKLICQKETSKVEGIPAHSVHLMFNDEKIRLANIQACESFDKSSYAQYQMPKDAIEAVGGWWAGAGEYLYLNKNVDDSYSVNYGQMYEGKETQKYDYTELIRIKKDDAGKYAAHPKHQLKDLVGVYTLGGHDNSWMLVVKPKGESVEATYYALDGMMPPMDHFKEKGIPGEGQVLKNFDVDFSDMVINSDIGEGQLEVIFGRERITFFNIKSHQEDMLRVTKDESLAFLTK